MTTLDPQPRRVLDKRFGEESPMLPIDQLVKAAQLSFEERLDLMLREFFDRHPTIKNLYISPHDAGSLYMSTADAERGVTSGPSLTSLLIVAEKPPNGAVEFASWIIYWKSPNGGTHADDLWLFQEVPPDTHSRVSAAISSARRR